jgi:hypothetical protein
MYDMAASLTGGRQDARHVQSMSAPLNGSQLASDQSFDCGKRRLVQLKLEQLEFEVVNLVLRFECGGQIAAPLGIVRGDRL